MGCGRPFGPNRRSSESTVSCRGPPSARDGHFASWGIRGQVRSGLDSEELVEGGEKLFAGKSALLDVDDGAAFVVEDGDW